MDDMGRFKQVGTEMSVDFAVDSTMINSGAAGLPLSCLYHLTISSCWLTTPSEASKNGDCKWAQHRQGTHICQRGPRLHTCEALKNRFRMC